MSRNPIDFCRQAVLLSGLISTVLAGGSAFNEQLLTSENLSRLSEIRFLTVGQPDEVKCGLYRTRLKEIVSSVDYEADLFGRVIDFLKQKKLPFQNTYALVDEMQRCLGTSEARKQDEQDTRATPTKDDPRMATEVDGLRRELDRTKRKTAESEAQVAQLKSQLEEVRGQLEELIRSPEGSDKVCKADKSEHESKMEREIDLLRKEAEQAKNEVELDEDGEMRTMQLAQETVGNNDKLRRATYAAVEDTALANREEQAVELYKNLSNGPGQCIKFHLLLRQEHPLTINDVAAIAQLDFAGMKSIIYNMNREFKSHARQIYDALKSRGSKLHSDVADELYNCAGLNSCNGGARCNNWSMNFVFHERN